MMRTTKVSDSRHLTENDPAPVAPGRGLDPHPTEETNTHMVAHDPDRRNTHLSEDDEVAATTMAVRFAELAWNSNDYEFTQIALAGEGARVDISEVVIRNAFIHALLLLHEELALAFPERPPLEGYRELSDFVDDRLLRPIKKGAR